MTERCRSAATDVKTCKYNTGVVFHKSDHIVLYNIEVAMLYSLVSQRIFDILAELAKRTTKRHMDV